MLGAHVGLEYLHAPVISVRNQPFGLALHFTFTSDLELVTCGLSFLSICV